MVNSVSFGTRLSYDAKADINAPQKFARPAAPTVAPEQKPANNHKVLKTIAGVVATAAVIAGGLAVGSKYGIFDPAKLGKLLGKYKDASWLAGAKKPVKAVLGALDTAGKFVLENSKAAYGAVKEYGQKGIDWVKGLFSRKAA